MVVSDNTYEGKIGRITQDDKDQRPYRLTFRDGRISNFMAVEQVRRATMVSERVSARMSEGGRGSECEDE